MTAPLTINLSGKTAVVTGGSGVLGGRMAEALASCGARVAVLNRRKEASAAAAERLKAMGAEALGVSADVTDKASLLAARAEVEAALGPCDILVNAAGGNHPRGNTSREFLMPGDLAEPRAAGAATFFDLEPEGFNHVFTLNFHGTFLATQVFAESMARRGAGSVVNISSMSALRPLTKVAAYGAAKAAVENFTRWLAVNLAKSGVRVNAISPGFFLTEQNRSLLTNPDGSLTPRGNAVVSHTPMGRFGTASELDGALLWLADSAASGFVTGIVVPVDGGFSAYSGV